MNVAVFRPADERLDRAVDLLEALGATPVPDPMLEVAPTGDAPRSDGDFAILTSKTGVELADDAGWTPGDAALCAIGDATASACRDAGWTVARVPDEYTSAGLVAELDGDVEGARVEVARSDHGSAVLTDGLNDAGAYVHETILYELTTPEGAGDSAELAADGDLDAALFTSSLTVEHWLDAASDRGIREDALAGLNDATVGCIGPPTRETAEAAGVDVDVVPDDADFEQLARAVLD
ncbi:uroporphyrinogen-III synthase [Halobacterium litoreum]|uniref:Uroporphyrinogen-III synthase n=1 Tax=Halobacterium litoreum TaxID=2039234 RepID=A0ABD5NF77_9EURY|nr:uroporphyrinogen-III synthase [Halobacterium litoreum]UHH13407.1 uroporphyrinogen-III synthase [Halobacterium litoreum]